jgi:hypothetical protein
MRQFEGRETRAWAAQPRTTPERVRELYDLLGGRRGGSRTLAQQLGYENVKSGMRQVGLWMQGKRAVPPARAEGLRGVARQFARQQRQRVAAELGRTGVRAAFKGHVTISSRTGVHLNMHAREIGTPGSRSEEAWQGFLAAWVADSGEGMRAGFLDVLNTGYLEGGGAEASVLEDVDPAGLQFGAL